MVAEAGRIIETPLDMSKPLWEIHVIEGLNKVKGFPKGCFAIVHKKHHGQFDGGSVTYLKSVMHTLEPGADTKDDPTKTPAPAGPAPTPFELLYHTSWKSLLRPMERLSFFYRTLPNIGKALNAAMTDNIKTVFGGAVRKYMLHHDELPQKALIA